MSDDLVTWAELTDKLRAETGLSQEDLAYEARDHGAPSTLTGSWISQLKSGKRPLSLDVLIGIAGALGIEPERFAEYRLAIARQQLDEREVGLAQALQALEAYERGEPMNSAGAADSDEQRAKRAALAAKRAREATQKSPQRSPGKQASRAKKHRAGQLP